MVRTPSYSTDMYATRTTDCESGSPQMLLDLLHEVGFRDYPDHRIDSWQLSIPSFIFK